MRGRVGRALLATGLVAGMAVGVALPAAGAPTEIRIDGGTGPETSVLISQETHPEGADVVVLAADNPDAFGGVRVAQVSDAPLLTSPTGQAVPDAVIAEIERLDPTTVVIMGGGASIPAAADQQVEATGATVERIAGDTRVDTAVLASGTTTPGTSDVVVGSGQALALGVVAAAEAARQGVPVLLASNSGLASQVLAEIDRLDPSTITLVGGPDTFPPSVAETLEGRADTLDHVEIDDPLLAALAIAERTGVAGSTLTVSQRPYVSDQGFFTALSGVAAYPGPFLYAEGDAVIRQVLEDTPPDTIRLLGDATLEAPADSVPPGGTFISAEDALPGQLAVAVLTPVGGEFAVETTDAVFGNPIEGTMPVSASIRVELPASLAPNPPSILTLLIDLGDVPVGAGHDDVLLQLNGLSVQEDCTSDDQVRCVRARGLVGDDLFIQIQTRDSNVRLEGVVPNLVRRAGVTRYDTGNAVATQRPLSGGAQGVFVATGQQFPDALSAAAIAGAQGSRVLITPGDGSDPAVDAAIRELSAEGAVLVGGEAAVANGTVSAVPTQRLSGANRYATSATLATAAYPNGAPFVYLATGRDFPDALTAAVSASVNGLPVLLTESDRLPDETVQALRTLGTTQAAIIGGEAVVGDAVRQQLADLDIATGRVAGTNRYATAAQISSLTFPQGANIAYLATGLGFADALTGAPLAAESKGPLLLTLPDRLPAETIAELQRLQPQRIVVLGGTGAVADAVLAQAAAYLS